MLITSPSIPVISEILMIFRTPPESRATCTITWAAEDPDRQVEPRHPDHHFEPAEGVARVVGVDGGHAPVVAGVHRLEHVERLGPAALADDDPVGPHAQRVA